MPSRSFSVTAAVLHRGYRQLC